MLPTPVSRSLTESLGNARKSANNQAINDQPGASIPVLAPNSSTESRTEILQPVLVQIEQEGGHPIIVEVDRRDLVLRSNRAMDADQAGPGLQK